MSSRYFWRSSLVDLTTPVEVEDEIAELLGQPVHLHLDLELPDLGLALVEGLVGLLGGSLDARGELVHEPHQRTFPSGPLDVIHASNLNLSALHKQRTGPVL